MFMNWENVILEANKKRGINDLEIFKSDAEWKQILTPEVYHITRKKGTERPFSNQMCNSFESGKYECVCCGTTLFDAEEKFESGTGWPSFTKPVDDNAIVYVEDNSFGHQRIEVCCKACDSHLGHVFPDGPLPTRLRFCVNALSLKKVTNK